MRQSHQCAQFKSTTIGVGFIIIIWHTFPTDTHHFRPWMEVIQLKIPVNAIAPVLRHVQKAGLTDPTQTSHLQTKTSTSNNVTVLALLALIVCLRCPTPILMSMPIAVPRRLQWMLNGMALRWVLAQLSWPRSQSTSNENTSQHYH